MRMTLYREWPSNPPTSSHPPIGQGRLQCVRQCIRQGEPMRPVYVRKLFELLRGLEVEVSQAAMARHWGVTDSTISMWASGQRPLAKRQKEAFIAFVAERMTEAYAPLKATLAAGIARAHPLPEMVSPPNLEHGPGFTDYELAALVLIEHALPEDTPARQAYNHAMK